MQKAQMTQIYLKYPCYLRHLRLKNISPSIEQTMGLPSNLLSHF